METNCVKIHLNRGGQSLGQFTPEDVRSGYREGKFAGTDLAWRDGMPMWKPLSEVIDELAPDDGGEDLFAHFSAIQMQGFKSLKEGQKVSFEVTQGPKGKQASNIQAA